MKPTVIDVRALLRDFGKSDWRELALDGKGWALFMAKPGARSNPFTSTVTASHGSDAVTAQTVSAPHLGILALQCGEGQWVKEGEALGALHVLDRVTPLMSTGAGRVSLHFKDGDLIEYGNAVLSIA